MARTEGDTWDLASSVGATATGVAASRALASKQPDPLINDPLRRRAGQGRRPRVLQPNGRRRDWSSSDDPLFNRQRICEQIAVRTRFFDNFFTGAAAAGIRQAVILASGLDTRAYRLPWPPDAVVFEIDQPQVIEFKSTTTGRSWRHSRRRSAAGCDRSSRRLADSPAGQRIRFDPADGLDRRGAADLPAARRPGPLVRQHHHSQRPGQPAGDRTHGHSGFTRRMDREAQ